MKVVFNCCTQPAKYSHNAGITLFKGEKPEVAVQAQVKPEQPATDTVTLSTKQPAAKTEASTEAKPEVKPEVKPEAVANK